MRIECTEVSPKPEKPRLNDLVQRQRALDLQINTAREIVENEPRFFCFEEEVGLPEYDVTSLHSLEEEFDSAKPTPSSPPHPKFCPLVKMEFVYLKVEPTVMYLTLHQIWLCGKRKVVIIPKKMKQRTR